ncbi:TonB-dependent receptor [Sphingosinicellaceae bacterium]|nr:TonB-dependent receptor [Sphingosinicellaceae bacterium]
MNERDWAIVVASAVLAVAQPAGAQIAADAAPDRGQAGTPPSSQTATSNGLVLDDIVVTAQKREQSRQDVPISINAFNAQAIAALSAESIGDLDKFTPGLSINDTSVTQPSYTIRGVSTDDFGIGTEPSVGIFIDGVYSARSGGSLVFFNDVERVEVLKGPQGTLFGRNTSAGAISIITNKPVDKLEAFATVQLGNYSKTRADATINVPLSDTLYFRANGVFNRRDGYLHDAVTGEDREREHNWSGRAALRWAPSPSTDVVLAYDHDDTNKDGPASVGVSVFALNQDPFKPFTNDVIGNKETRILNDVSLTIRQDIGKVSLTSITAYKKFATHNREDEDGTGDPTRYFDTENIEHNKSFYQELRLGYDSDKLNLIAGVSYFHERARQTSAATLLTDSVDRLVNAVTTAQGQPFPIFTILDSVGLPVFGLPFREDMNNRAANESYAAFADATYHVTDKFSVIAGLRYTHDDKKFTWENGGFISPGLEAVAAPGALYNAILGADAFPADASISAADFFRATVGANGLIFDEGALEGVPFTRHEKFNDVSPRFVVQYQLDDDKLLYASATRGYKAGGYNSTEINSFFKPENVWNFEGGFKTELFDRRLRFNAAGYYFKYRNRQSISLESVAGSELPQYITRSGDSRAYGLDLETQFVVTRALTLSATAGAIDSKWVTRVERDIDISHQPTGEPSFRGVLSAHYAHEIGEHGTIFADASYSYTSRVRINDAVRDSDASIAAVVDFSKLKKLRSPENVVNAKIGWRLPGDHLSLSLYTENLFNDQRLRTLNTISADIFGTPYVRVDKPRFFGVEIGLRY